MIGAGNFVNLAKRFVPSLEMFPIITGDMLVIKFKAAASSFSSTQNGLSCHWHLIHFHNQSSKSIVLDGDLRRSIGESSSVFLSIPRHLVTICRVLKKNCHVHTFWPWICVSSWYQFSNPVVDVLFRLLSWSFNPRFICFGPILILFLSPEEIYTLLQIGVWFFWSVFGWINGQTNWVFPSSVAMLPWRELFKFREQTIL